MTNGEPNNSIPFPTVDPAAQRKIEVFRQVCQASKQPEVSSVDKIWSFILLAPGAYYQWPQIYRFRSLVVLLVGVTLFLFTWYGFLPRRKLPPGPRNWPLLGALSEMEPRLHRAFDRLARQYGPVVYFRLGMQNVVLVSSAEAAEEVLKHRDAEFSDREAAMTRLVGKYTAMKFASVVFANYGADVKLQRKIFQTEFLTGAKLKASEAIRGKEMAAMVENIFSQIESSDSSKEDQGHSSCLVGIRKVLVSVNQNIIFTLCIGKRFDDLQSTDEIRKWPKLMDDVFDTLMMFNSVDFFPFLEWLDPQGVVKEFKKIEKRMTEFFDMVLGRFKQARKQLKVKTELLVNEGDRNPRNLLDILPLSQEEGGEISDHFLKLTFHNLLMTGIHTTANQLEWVLLELVRHPSLLRRLQNEIDEVVGKERPVRETDFQALPFLNAIVMETLRLHQVTPFSFPHVNMEPSTLGGYHIPPRTAVLVNIRTIGRDPKAWTNPLQFNPDRFMEGNSKSISPALGKNYNSLAFSSGRRMCVGASLATIMLLRTVATLVHAFELSPPSGRSAEDLSVEEDVMFVLQPFEELFLTCRPRLIRHVYQRSIF